MTIAITPLSPSIGAEITGVDLRAHLDSDTVAAIHHAWLDHLVILFRDQKLEQEDLVRFTAHFGQPAERSSPKDEQTVGQSALHRNLMLISNIRENGVPIGSLPDGELVFHHDMTFRDLPGAASILYAVEVPAHGGNTMFANCYAAYETLPDDVRQALEGRQAFHHYHFGSARKGDGKGTKASAQSTHPVFRTHDETGRKAVFVNRLMTDYVVDMPRDESDDLLARVFEHCERPEFVYEHVWRVGDLLMWDNRCSMHARTDFPSTERRLMWRTTLEGSERPV
jgi:taurine dioxygenase